MSQSLIFAPSTAAFDKYYRPTEPEDSSFPKEMEKFPDANDYYDQKSYLTALLKWYSDTKLTFENSLLPVPLSFSYHYPTAPHVPTAQEKIPRSQQEIIAARSFNVKTTPLYPENHLELQEMALKGFTRDGDFPKFGPRGQKIPITNHLKVGQYFTNTLIPPKPQPYFFRTYEDYQFAMNNWISVAQNELTNIPNSKTIGDMIKIQVVEEDRPQNYSYSQEDLQIHLEADQPKPKLPNLSETSFTIDERLRHARFSNINPRGIVKSLNNLRFSFKRAQTSPKQKEQTQVDAHFEELALLPLDQLRNWERQNFVSSIANYNPSCVNPDLYLGCLSMTMNHACSRHYRFTVFSIVEGLLNREFSDLNVFFNNSIELLYAYIALIQEFSPIQVTVYEPGPTIPDSNDSTILLNHAKTTLLELSYNKVLLKHYETKQDKFNVVYQIISMRHNGLKFQANQLITYMSKQLVESIQQCMKQEFAYTIGLTILLVLESETPMIESFLMNSKYTFFDMLVGLYNIDKEQYFLLQKRILFSRVAATSLLPLLFPIFSQYPLHSFNKEPYVILSFLRNMFLIDPRALERPRRLQRRATVNGVRSTMSTGNISLQQDNSFQQQKDGASVSFIPFYLAKLVTIIDDKTADIFYCTIYQLCVYAKRGIKYCPSNDTKQTELVIREAIKSVFSITQHAHTEQSKLYILQSLKTLFTLPQSQKTISSMKQDNCLFFFNCMSDNSERVKMFAWNVFSSLYARNKQFRSTIIEKPTLRSKLNEACYRPSDSCIVYVLRMMTEVITKNKEINKKTFLAAIQATNTPEFQELKTIVIAPDVKIESLIRTLIGHKTADNVPMQFYVISVFKEVIAGMEEIQKKKTKKSKK